MARRPSTKSTTSTTDQATEATTEQAQEATVSTDTSTVEPTTESTESTTAAAEAPAEATPVNLDAFQAAVGAAYETKDESTGTIPDAGIASVVKEYRNLDGLKPKNAARAWLQDQMKERMADSDLPGARAYLNMTENLSAGSTSGGEKAPVDPTEAFVQRAAGLRLALTLVGNNVPEGVAEDWADRAKKAVADADASANAYQAWLASDAEDKGDQPDTPSWVQAAVKLAQGKSARVGTQRSGGGSTFTGTRRDVAKHIAEAFADKAEGDFLTIAQIRSHKSEEYGDDQPSAGAISARLFPSSGKCTVEGVTPAEVEGKKGARKA